MALEYFATIYSQQNKIALREAARKIQVAHIKISEAECRAEIAEYLFNRIENSNSWRVTAPIRATKHQFTKYKHSLLIKTTKPLINLIKFIKKNIPLCEPIQRILLKLPIVYRILAKYKAKFTYAQPFDVKNKPETPQQIGDRARGIYLRLTTNIKNNYKETE